MIRGDIPTLLLEYRDVGRDRQPRCAHGLVTRERDYRSVEHVLGYAL